MFAFLQANVFFVQPNPLSTVTSHLTTTVFFYLIPNRKFLIACLLLSLDTYSDICSSHPCIYSFLKILKASST